jgi:hypothetical protein
MYDQVHWRRRGSRARGDATHEHDVVIKQESARKEREAGATSMEDTTT